MIWFIDDEPLMIAEYLEALEAEREEVLMLESASDVSDAIAHAPAPDLIVLDVMLPGDVAFDTDLDSHGLTAGLSLFGSLRARFPGLPVVVLTNNLSAQVQTFFSDQTRCWFCPKADVLPDELARLVVDIVSDKGSRLLATLRSLSPGRTEALAYERIVSSLLDYLFVPPLERVLSQVPRGEGHDIRDIVLVNNTEGGFWSRVRQELASRHVVVECKNYVEAVKKQQVQQLQDYLSRKSIGRFGLLSSRLEPSGSALTARAKAYEDHDVLVLFLSDADLEEMVRLRGVGSDPSVLLARQKEQFELSY